MSSPRLSRSISVHTRLIAAYICCALLLGMFVVVEPAKAITIPNNIEPQLYYQTSGRERGPTVGDWYTTKTSASTDRKHRISIIVPSTINPSTTLTVTINDA